MLNTYQSLGAAAACSLRIVSALLFLEHGWSRSSAFRPAPSRARSAPLLFGNRRFDRSGRRRAAADRLFTRPVAFLLAGEMAVGYFMVHAPANFYPAINGGDAGDPVSASCFCIWPRRARAPGASTRCARPKRADRLPAGSRAQVRVIGRHSSTENKQPGGPKCWPKPGLPSPQLSSSPRLPRPSRKRAPHPGGNVRPCSLDGVNPAHHPQIFGNPATARELVSSNRRTTLGAWISGCAKACNTAGRERRLRLAPRGGDGKMILIGRRR